MNIAFVNESLSGGGAERATVNLANGLCLREDTNVSVITGDKKDNDYELSDKVTRVCLITKKLIADSQTVKRYLTENNIDVVIGMGIYANFCVCLINSKRLKTKVVISERNSPKHDNISKKSKLLRFLIYRRADGYVFQTGQAREFYSKKIQERSVVIHNPVKAVLPHRTDRHNKEIVAVGRLMPQKNYDLLIRAFFEVCKKNNDYILRIFGEGKEKESLEQLCNELVIAERVRFEGFSANVHDEMKDSDIFVMSSDFEGMPNSLMEAMAMGFPVISTDCPCGGPAELIENRKNGLLTPVGDTDGMAECIMRLIADEELKENIARTAGNIRNTHSMNKIVSYWIEFLTIISCKKDKRGCVKIKATNNSKK